jgi:hypothetical protein
MEVSEASYLLEDILPQNFLYRTNERENFKSLSYIEIFLLSSLDLTIHHRRNRIAYTWKIKKPDLLRAIRGIHAEVDKVLHARMQDRRHLRDSIVIYNHDIRDIIIDSFIKKLNVLSYEKEKGQPVLEDFV